MNLHVFHHHTICPPGESDSATEKHLAEILNSYAKEAFPGVKHETVHIEHTDTVSYQQGCRYGLTIPLRDCAAIEGISL